MLKHINLKTKLMGKKKKTNERILFLNKASSGYTPGICLHSDQIFTPNVLYHVTITDVPE